MTDVEAKARAGLTSLLLRRLSASPAVGKVCPVGHPSNRKCRFSLECWTVSLSRRVMALAIDLRVPGLENHTRHEAIAAKLLDGFIAVQNARQELAESQSLRMSPGRSLRVEAIRLDRDGARLLFQHGMDPVQLVECHRYSSSDNGLVDEACCWAPPPLGVPTLVTIALSRRHKVPVLACGLPVGAGVTPAELSGNVLAVDAVLPATMLIAAVGRQLGELVETGTPTLDRRRILRTGRRDGRTEIRLRPDLITIGEARRLFSGV